MPHLNIEIKARCANPQRIETILIESQARYAGEDRQIDTYFDVPQGRLKLREGRIEQSLIFYERPETPGLKKSEVVLYPTPGEAGGLKAILIRLFGVRVVVDKVRKIFFIDNVKFHLDRIEGLGTFLEIEAIDADESLGEAKLREQCRYYMEQFGCRSEDLIAQSYSDMMLDLANQP